MKNDTRRLPGRLAGGVICLLILVLAGFVMRHRSAAVPAAFDATVTYAQGVANAKAANKPVLVFATADWCGPCQVLKRGALADERVGGWIRANTAPVYLDIDRARETAVELGVRSIPVLIVVRDDRVVDRLEGVHDADSVLAWLRRAK